MEELQKKIKDLEEENKEMKTEVKEVMEKYEYVVDRFMPGDYEWDCDECDKTYFVWNKFTDCDLGKSHRMNFDLCYDCDPIYDDVRK